MNSTGLIETFRSDVVDVAKPYLWHDAEVIGYANDAYRMFVRKTGGIPDFMSEACTAEIIADEPNGVLHDSILRVMSAQRRSDNRSVKIINYTDLPKFSVRDYGQTLGVRLDDTRGAVNYGVIGMQRGIVRWVNIPVVNDTLDMMVYRLPLNRITDFDQDFSDIDEDHHLPLLHWMKYRAYSKQDAETFDKGRADTCRAEFEDYCAFVKAEVERYKHKTRVVQYGG